MIAADIRDTPADNATPHGRNASATDPISPDGRPEPGRLYTVPPREGRGIDGIVESVAAAREAHEVGAA